MCLCSLFYHSDSRTRTKYEDVNSQRKCIKDDTDVDDAGPGTTAGCAGFSLDVLSNLVLWLATAQGLPIIYPIV